MIKETTSTILEVAGEGGSIRLVCRHSIKTLYYAVMKGEGGVFDGEIYEGLSVQQPMWFESWADALADLDSFPWAALYPLYVAPAFQVPVLAALAPRLVEDGHWDEHQWNTWLECIERTGEKSNGWK